MDGRCGAVGADRLVLLPFEPEPEEEGIGMPSVATDLGSVELDGAGLPAALCPASDGILGELSVAAPFVCSSFVDKPFDCGPPSEAETPIGDGALNNGVLKDGAARVGSASDGAATDDGVSDLSCGFGRFAGSGLFSSG